MCHFKHLGPHSSNTSKTSSKHVKLMFIRHVHAQLQVMNDDGSHIVLHPSAPGHTFTCRNTNWIPNIRVPVSWCRFNYYRQNNNKQQWERGAKDSWTLALFNVCSCMFFLTLCSIPWPLFTRFICCHRVNHVHQEAGLLLFFSPLTLAEITTLWNRDYDE